MKYITFLTIYSLILVTAFIFMFKALATPKMSQSPDIYYCVFSASGKEEICDTVAGENCHTEPVKTYSCFNPSLDEHCSVTEFINGEIRTTCAYVDWKKDKPK
jgi:hypothetical protein